MKDTGRREITEKEVRERLSPTLLALKMKEGAMSHRKWAAYRSWKRQENMFSHRDSGKEFSLSNALVLAQ